MTDTYSEFPITMAHPHFVAAKSTPIPGTEIRDRMGNVTRQDYQGTPEKFPPVTAMNEDDEEFYASQGYERAGKIDPSAWVRAHADAPPPNYQPQKYPMWKNGALIMTAQEDPDATADDLDPPKAEAEPEPVAQPSHDENLMATLVEMRRLMAAQAEELAALKAEKSTETAAEPDDDADDGIQAIERATASEAPPEPRHKRTYQKRAGGVAR